ncbi:MAG: hypothetical protein EZS28_031321, partial [Streblomastix strix]
AEIDNATFDSIIDSIEAEHTLLKYKGTRQTRVLKKRAFGFQNQSEIEEQKCLGWFE